MYTWLKLKIVFFWRSGARRWPLTFPKAPVRVDYASTRGELDLVMRTADTLVFVEVKTRRSENVAPVEAAVTPAKQKRMTAAAKHFIRAHELQDCPCRFDVVAVLMDEHNKAQITHYPNAFGPTR